MSNSTDRIQSVLLIEDDDSAQYIFGTILKHAGYRTVTARDAQAAWRAIEAETPDLVIMDIGLPGEADGFELTEDLRRDARMKDVPIVVITVYAFEADMERAKQAGCTSFMAKPVEPLRVLAEVQRLIGPPEGHTTAGPPHAFDREG